METKRRLTPEDTARIRCQAIYTKRIGRGQAVMETCGARALWCIELRWTAGGRNGVSFFYRCENHQTLRRED